MSGPQQTISESALQAERMNKKFGDRSVMLAKDRRRGFPRIPSREFSLDWLTRGGLPVWGITGFYGAESAGKSTMMARVIASAQRTCIRCLSPLPCKCEPSRPSIVFLIDLEGDIDFDWYERLGVIKDQLYIVTTKSGTEGFTAMRMALSAEDCLLVAVDSVAHADPIDRVLDEDSLWDRQPGRQAVLVTEALKKIRATLQENMRRDKPSTVLFLNQIRAKIGQAFGPTEGEAGCHMLKHSYTLSIRFSRKSIPKEKRAKYQFDDIVGATGHIISVEKNRMALNERSFEFIRVNYDLPDAGFRVGQVDDVPQVLTYAKRLGHYGKDTQGYHLFRDHFKTQKDMIQRLRNDETYYFQVCQRIIASHRVPGVWPQLEAGD